MDLGRGVDGEDDGGSSGRVGMTKMFLEGRKERCSRRGIKFRAWGLVAEKARPWFVARGNTAESLNV
jgi:hypothetical protein